MCGIFGVYGHENAADLTYLGLYALQHRGEESAGMAVADKGQLSVMRGMGLAADVFSKGQLAQLQGESAIGHVRYSTSGSSIAKNAQPFLAELPDHPIAIAHNGNLVNMMELKTALEREGALFQSTMDSELFVHLIARSRAPKLLDRLVEALQQVRGAYSLVVLTPHELIAVRDPHGFRPLCLGRLGDGLVVGSETCAFDLIQTKYVRDIDPGEILVINRNGQQSIKPFPPAPPAMCIFEHIYFSRPDSTVFGANVYLARKELGRQLAREWPAEADVVMPVPDSGNYAALGYAEESDITFEMGIIRNHYIGRTFIQPAQAARDLGVKVKLNPTRELIRGKRIVIVEDSIVRGTTSRIRVKALREAGAKEIHMRVSCPPLISPCYYGIDFPTAAELVASANSVEEIRRMIGVDSLGYLSLEGMLSAMPLAASSFCTACFTGRYPVAPAAGQGKYQCERSRSRDAARYKEE